MDKLVVSSLILINFNEMGVGLGLGSADIAYLVTHA